VLTGSFHYAAVPRRSTRERRLPRGVGDALDGREGSAPAWQRRLPCSPRPENAFINVKGVHHMAIHVLGRRGTDVGMDGETNVSADYEQGRNTFTGKIVKVTVEEK
jgi:hypothetical protein